MFSLVLESFGLPLRRLDETLKVFWPWPVMWAAAFIPVVVPGGWSTLGRSGALILTIGGIYTLILMTRSAVEWHQAIILGTRIEVTPPIPNGATWRYVGWSIAVSVLVTATAFIVSFVAIFLWLLAGNTERLMETWFVAVFGGPILTFFFFIIFGEVVLRLPRTSIVDVSGPFVPLRWFGMRDRRAAIVFSILAALYSLTYFAALNIAAVIDGVGLAFFILLLSLVNIWLGIAGITLLSLIYAQAAKGRRLVPA